MRTKSLAMRLDPPAEGAQMMGFRFSLMLELGMGTATPTAGIRHKSRPEAMTRRRAVARPEPLGAGPLEPEELGRWLGEQEFRPRVW